MPDSINLERDALRVMTLDICAQGFERLRTRSEFILVAYVSRGSTRASVAEQWRDSLQCCERREGFPWEQARGLIADSAEANGPWIESACAELEEASEDSDSCVCLLYISDKGIAEAI